MALSDRNRRRLWKLAIVLVAMASLALWVHRQLRPEILTPIVLKQIGDAQGLVLSIDGEPDYALRPEPRLLLPGLAVRAQGSDTPWLKAKHAEISLPWDTLTGGEPIITRIELERPLLDLPLMFAWLDSRPVTDDPLTIPTLTEGLRIVQGELRDEAFALQQLDMELPSLQAGEAADIRAEAELRIGKVEHPLTLKLRCTPEADGKTLLLADSDLTFQSDTPLPNLRLRGEWRIGSSLTLRQRGTLDNWPGDWPALPTPLSQKQPPFPLALGYAGKSDFSDVMHITLSIPEHPINARLRVPALQAWLADSSTPLPPIDADYATREIVMDGVTLNDVQIEVIDDEQPSEAREDVRTDR